MSPKDWLAEAEDKLQVAGVSSPRLDAQLMLEHVTERDRASLSIDESELDTDSIKQLAAMLKRRLTREPLAYILGIREFYGIDFQVDGGVLVPRPETEVMVEYIIKNAPQSAAMLELGTGSGAIAIASAKNRADLSVLATDVSEDALMVAKRNAKSAGVTVDFIGTDLFESIDGAYDLIAANLPYVPEPARRQPEIEHEPDVALYGGEDGLDFYRDFFSQLHHYLNEDGFAIVEYSPTQFKAVREIAEGFSVEPLSEYIYLVTKC